MTYMLNSIDEAVDQKFLVTKNLSNQVKSGSMIHIMATKELDHGVVVDYRVTDTGQDFSVKFQSVRDFCNWARPDTFIARYHDSFSAKEIQHYIKVNNRSFTNFCLPIIVVALIVIWILGKVVMHGAGGTVFAIIFSLIAVIGTYYLYTSQKKSVKLKLYQKVSTNWGIAFK